MGGGDIISGNRDCWARERERAEERCCCAADERGSVLCALLHLRSLRSLESPHTKLKITCHRKIRHHQVHRERQCARIIILNYVPWLQPLRWWRISLFRQRALALLSRGAESEWVRERAALSWPRVESERECMREWGGWATSECALVFSPAVAAPGCWCIFNAPNERSMRCPNQTNCFSIMVNSFKEITLRALYYLLLSSEWITF
jgi:hypothetical protein